MVRFLGDQAVGSTPPRRKHAREAPVRLEQQTLSATLEHDG